MIEIVGLNIEYQRKLLNQVGFKTSSGFVTLIRGESGSGKTSMLYRIALLSTQKDFDYFLNGINIRNYNEHKKAEIRKHHIAYVLQDSSLINYYNVKENIYYYADMVGITINDQDAINILRDVRLDVSLDREIKTLSGGERQRLAIACALLKNCEIIVLDEPTSSLDMENEENIFELISKLAFEKKKCIIVASHSPKAEEYSQIVYEIQNHQLVLIKDNKNICEVSLEKEVLNNKTKFLFNYVKAYFKKFKKKQFINVMVTLFSFFLIFFTILGINYYYDESYNELIKMSDNQVYISNNENSKYVDKSNKTLSNDILNTILTEQGNLISSYYPYIYSQIEIAGEKIDIIPYYKENHFEDKFDHKNNLVSDKLILGYETSQLLKRNNISTQFIDTIMTVRIDNDSSFSLKDIGFSKDVGGVLQNGEQNHYSENKYFIYMPNNYINEVYNIETKNKQFMGYTLFSKSLDDHAKLVKNLEKYNVIINNNFQNSVQLERIVENTQLIKFILIGVIFVGTLFIVSYMNINQFNLRRKEFVLSIIAGLSTKDIIKIGVIESLYQNGISFILFGFTSLVSLLFSIIMLNEFMQVLGIIFLEFICIIIVVFVLNYVQMRKISVEDVLRKM